MDTLARLRKAQGHNVAQVEKRGYLAVWWHPLSFRPYLRVQSLPLRASLHATALGFLEFFDW
ncbi:uncharacterized protein N7469_001963 [Penicillium citrinum]|uniref:Uncharacterized protein n=1 Tax=Penicillium citrinum TaxID=5077 RepID=A0A9W9PCH2_PENCI|nr:uncharacterized protein N7469_001963 [Penicillium citrinum]KAJ5240372.1 hypothetical protein N7469_001963 [Penicillium citrinum]